MTKGRPTFGIVSNTLTAQQAHNAAFAADLAPVVAAIRALGEQMKQEIRVDLPAMNPTFNAPPVSVTVPEFPKAPAIQITMPDQQPITFSASVSYAKLAAIACIPPCVYTALQWALAALA